MSTLHTNSQMKCLRRCPRLHYFQYEQLVRPKVKADALVFGTLAHWLCELYWKSDEERKADYAQVLDKARNEFERIALSHLKNAYISKWQDNDRRIKALFVEHEFRFEIESFEFGGKMDGLVELPDGRVVVLEHKTTSAFEYGATSRYRRALDMDTQISHYIYAARSMGYQVDSVLYDVIPTPPRPLKMTPPAQRRYRRDGKLYKGQSERDETPAEYDARLHEAYKPHSLVRYEVHRLDSEIEEWKQDAVALARQRSSMKAFDTWPRSPERCFDYGRQCEFYDVCTRCADLDDERFEQLETAHPELDAPSEGKSE